VKQGPAGGKGEENWVARGLAQIVKVKEPIVRTNFDKYAKNVEAILLNPTWLSQKDKKGNLKGVTMEDFA
jgi:hypothetical protein